MSGTDGERTTHHPSAAVPPLGNPPAQGPGNGAVPHPPQAGAPAPPAPAYIGRCAEDRWPLRSFLELGALPGAVSCARLHTRHRVWEWSLTSLTDSAELAVTELVTNAVKASRALDWPHPVRLWLRSNRMELLILVWDANLQPPVRIDADSDAESGRGLLLVATISEQWGWYPGAETGGKIVWARIASGQPANPPGVTAAAGVSADERA